MVHLGLNTAQCLAGSETVSHLAVAPCRELPGAWVKTRPEALCMCACLCVRVCALQSILFGCVYRCYCGLVYCGQSSGSFNAGAGAAFYLLL